MEQWRVWDLRCGLASLPPFINLGHPQLPPPVGRDRIHVACSHGRSIQLFDPGL